MNIIRLYGAFATNPSHPELIGQFNHIQDYGSDVPDRWWWEDSLCTVKFDVDYLRLAYRGYGCEMHYVAAIHKGWTVEYVVL